MINARTGVAILLSCLAAASGRADDRVPAGLAYRPSTTINWCPQSAEGNTAADYATAAQQALRGFESQPPVTRWQSSPIEDETVEQASHTTYVTHTPSQQFSCCPPPPRTWAMIAPFGWIPAMQGTITINNRAIPVDLSLSDVVNLLKDDLQGAAMLQLEAGRGDLGFIVNGMIVSLSSARTLGPLTANIDIDQTFLEGFGFYRVVDSSDSDVPWTVDVLGGLRYYSVDVAGQVFVGPVGPINVGQSNQWVDLVVGVRSAVALTESLEAFGRADVGGFGIGTSSDPAWNVQGGLRYRTPAIEGLSLVGGYKLLDIREYNSAGSPDAFGFDVRMHGPFAAIAYEF